MYELISSHAASIWVGKSCLSFTENSWSLVYWFIGGPSHLDFYVILVYLEIAVSLISLSFGDYFCPKNWITNLLIQISLRLDTRIGRVPLLVFIFSTIFTTFWTVDEKTLRKFIFQESVCLSQHPSMNDIEELHGRMTS